MRVIGTAERALALMCERARTRTAFGKLLAEQGVVQQAIARSRVELEQVRLLCHKAAWLMDTQGTKGGAHRDRRHQGGGAAGGLRRHRPRHPGARRRRHEQ